MLVSHSPPVFSHSPPLGGGYLTSANSALDNTNSNSVSGSRYTPNTCKSYNVTMSAGGGVYHYRPINNLSPRRPCLVKTNGADGNNDYKGVTNGCAISVAMGVPRTKKVVFADDKGMSLTHVKVMTEPSNVPPLWSLRFLAQVTRGLSAEPAVPEEPWEINFPQPASDYVAFRKKLDRYKVTLENVIIRESESFILGTVKVVNISFEKEVILRLTTDEWKTHEDIQCKYVSAGSNQTQISSIAGTYSLYDTFSFKVPLPPKSRAMEFCVRYKTGGDEFWDNNEEINYILSKKGVQSGKKPAPTEDYLLSQPPSDINGVYSEAQKKSIKGADIFETKVESWSEFASWTHLENETPYW